jgi:hypothetical protein
MLAMLLHEFPFLIVGRLRRADGLGGVEPGGVDDG